ncbi:hypothetical protein [Sporocytophaga myxococcoides]|uniref:hypothetical protein n=1 Tax=Sporocytophaga myxococcoides TaxID=153721 RepID=UPI00042A1CDF|nr:hypothetical protein [Sporocytophaga myxococcoides]
MSLVIVLSVGGRAPIFNPETSISLKGGDADYWYLWPTMIKEIKEETGELIDLYDDAEFSGDNLPKVEEIVIRQLEKLKQKKEKEWQVHIGTQIEPVKQEIFKSLIKKDLERKLRHFLKIMEQARLTNEKVICIGD